MCIQVFPGILGRVKEDRPIKRIVLTGFRGSGKSTVGKILSKKLNVAFTDTDLEIEKKEGMEIPEIFSRHGEGYFRKLEQEIIRNLPEKDCVVSTGGGAPVYDQNARHLRRNSYIIFLEIDAQTAFLRISESFRPALTKKDPEEETEYLIRKRYPAYVRTSDFCIDASGDPDEICDEILSLIFPVQEDIERRKQSVYESFSGVMMPPGKKEELFSFSGNFPAGSLCAIAGNPCIHSKSPLIYNTLFEKYGISGHYTYLQKCSAKETLEAFCAAKMRGLSVTIPYKEEIIPFLDRINRDAEELGAVNTVLNSCGQLTGYNTDWLGVKRPLEEAGLSPKRAVVLGAGGAARGAVYALRDMGAEVFVLNRTLKRAEELAFDFGCESGTPEKAGETGADLIINATSVGMDKKSMPLHDTKALRPGVTVFDLVYTPPVTRLLAEAEAAGCRIISGEEMFVHQAAEQFYLMFGVRVDPAEIREIIR